MLGHIFLPVQVLKAVTVGRRATPIYQGAHGVGASGILSILQNGLELGSRQMRC